MLQEKKIPGYPNLAIQDNILLLPIPQAEINKNKAFTLDDQNPGINYDFFASAGLWKNVK